MKETTLENLAEALKLALCDEIDEMKESGKLEKTVGSIATGGISEGVMNYMNSFGFRDKLAKKLDAGTNRILNRIGLDALLGTVINDVRQAVESKSHDAATEIMGLIETPYYIRRFIGGYDIVDLGRVIRLYIDQLNDGTDEDDKSERNEDGGMLVRVERSGDWLDVELSERATDDRADIFVRILVTSGGDKGIIARLMFDGNDASYASLPDFPTESQQLLIYLKQKMVTMIFDLQALESEYTGGLPYETEEDYA